jgi:hypothetical protein
LKDRSRDDRGLIVALRATQQPATPGTGLEAAAARTAKALWPAECEQVAAARFLVGETGLELLQRPRIILHEPGYYMLGCRESSAYSDATILALPQAIVNDHHTVTIDVFFR